MNVTSSQDAVAHVIDATSALPDVVRVMQGRSAVGSPLYDLIRTILWQKFDPGSR